MSLQEIEDTQQDTQSESEIVEESKSLRDLTEIADEEIDSEAKSERSIKTPGKKLNCSICVVDSLLSFLI